MSLDVDHGLLNCHFRREKCLKICIIWIPVVAWVSFEFFVLRFEMFVYMCQTVVFLVKALLLSFVNMGWKVEH